ncbi:hypothetical protein MNBD_GAMMA25-73 [hydrothermal vent metagenome]|uniref:ABC-type transport auxiliary lipoprotein component domain-containing protein n=1 Tax=hydrothermal vent metagenome TaxID=652676 RepID=A0A3B1BIB1_9ZZZZ
MPYLFALLLSSLLLSACGSTPPSQFYLIIPMSPEDDSSAEGSQAGIENIGLGLGPLRFPDYLSRNSIVRYEGESRVTIAETRRWAEPLEYSFSRVLAENLSRLLASDRILRYPWPAWRKPEYQLTMDVIRFDFNGKNEVELIVQWALLQAETKTPLLEKRSHFSQSTTDDFDDIVKAHSQVVAAFSQEIYVSMGTLN